MNYRRIKKALKKFENNIGRLNRKEKKALGIFFNKKLILTHDQIDKIFKDVLETDVFKI